MEAKSFLNDYYLTPGRTPKFIPPQRQKAKGVGGEVVMEPLARVFDMLQYFETILPSVESL